MRIVSHFQVDDGRIVVGGHGDELSEIGRECGDHYGIGRAITHHPYDGLVPLH